MMYVGMSPPLAPRTFPTQRETSGRLAVSSRSDDGDGDDSGSGRGWGGGRVRCVVIMPTIVGGNFVSSSDYVGDPTTTRR
jgi:hypothetical protein